MPLKQIIFIDVVFNGRKSWGMMYVYLNIYLDAELKLERNIGAKESFDRDISMIAIQMY